jgi:rubredoxin
MQVGVLLSPPMGKQLICSTDCGLCGSTFRYDPDKPVPAALVDRSTNRRATTETKHENLDQVSVCLSCEVPPEAFANMWRAAFDLPPVRPRPQTVQGGTLTRRKHAADT